ncbi:hypothetical protein HZ326_15575 [Fusarium oxysporum f. sp. albedinis]|nr:hypothetical protein HZ326_15575 [Fusarium oxysporum f. sp. albedinis]
MYSMLEMDKMRYANHRAPVCPWCFTACWLCLRRDWVRANGLAPIEVAGIEGLTSYNRTRATEGLGMVSEEKSRV